MVDPRLPLTQRASGIFEVSYWWVKNSGGLSVSVSKQPQYSKRPLSRQFNN